MSATTKILFNDFVAIENSLDDIIPSDDKEALCGTVVAVSLFVDQISVGDFVLYKKTSSYLDDGVSFDLARQSDIYLRNPIEYLP